MLAHRSPGCQILDLTSFTDVERPRPTEILQYLCRKEPKQAISKDYKMGEEDCTTSSPRETNQYIETIRLLNSENLEGKMIDIHCSGLPLEISTNQIVGKMEKKYGVKTIKMTMATYWGFATILTGHKENPGLLLPGIKDANTVANVINAAKAKEKKRLQKKEVRKQIQLVEKETASFYVLEEPKFGENTTDGNIQEISMIEDIITPAAERGKNIAQISNEEENKNREMEMEISNSTITQKRKRHHQHRELTLKGQ
ncbi:hypothetical protein CHS0354_000946 [Potamilus streckersoni]|uniref:Uncharacterized protein n=1 Tax=Potamilus streckersoni TaxID=2493646 RepID=A0AAE0W014_9BIVA|nr:hypothetical protein CHS0354_000946 [Potamilus streckersoni]